MGRKLGFLLILLASTAQGQQQVGIANSLSGAQVLAAAPGADTGQRAVAVRVVSQLGAGGGAASVLAADGTANPTIPQQSAFNFFFNGTTWDRMRGTVANGVLVNLSNASVAVTGTFWQATQPVSGPLTDAQLRAVAVPVSGTFFQATQPVSIAATVATSSTQLPAALDGSGFLKVHEQGTAAVSIAGTVAVSLATNTPDVTDRAARLLGHTVTDTGSTTAVTGNVTVVQPTGTNLHIACDSGCGGAASFTDNGAFTFGTTSVNNMGAVVDDVATNSVTENSSGTPRMSGTRILYVDQSKGGAIPTGNNVIGHVIADTGSTTAVTGNVAVTNAGLTNLDVALSTRTKPADQQHAIVDSGTLTAVTAITNALPTGTNTLGSVKVTDGTNVQSIFPATFARVSDEPHQVFYDPFDAALDTTNLWTAPTVAAPGVIAATASGVMTMGTGTTASGWSKLTSQATFKLSIPAWTGFSFAIAIPDLAAINANTTRFWGSGTIPATPTVGVPITDGVGFELSSAKMYAVVYANGVRTQIADLSTAGTAPTDTASHRYIIYVRTDKTYWYIDGLTPANLVATSNFQSPTIQTLPETFVAVGSASNVAAANITCSGAVVWDTGKNASQLADGTYPWRKATVSAAGALKVDGAAVTQPVSGTVTVTQATGTNLHAVLDTTSTTAVTQATAANLNATVSQATGTNLHVVNDAGAAVIGALTANQSVNMAQIAGTTTSVNAGVSDAGTIRVEQAQELTYSAGLTIKTNTAAGTGPFFSICGSATKTVSIQRLSISGTVATAAVWGDVILKRTSTATSGGTATTLTVLPMDSTNAAGSAVAKYYTVLATAGTSAGVIDAQTSLFPVTVISATLQPTPIPLIWRWRDQDSQPPTLRGVAQCVEANFGTTTTNAPTLTVGVVWTEK